MGKVHCNYSDSVVIVLGGFTPSPATIVFRLVGRCKEVEGVHPYPSKTFFSFPVGGGGHGSKVCPHLNQNCIVLSLFGHRKKEGGRVHPTLTKLYGWGGHRKKVRVHPRPDKNLLFLGELVVIQRLGVYPYADIISGGEWSSLVGEVIRHLRVGGGEANAHLYFSIFV